MAGGMIVYYNEGDPVPGDGYVRAAGWRAGSVDDSTVSNEEVGRRTLSGEWTHRRDEQPAGQQGGRSNVAQSALDGRAGTNGVVHRAKLRRCRETRPVLRGHRQRFAP